MPAVESIKERLAQKVREAEIEMKYATVSTNGTDHWAGKEKLTMSKNAASPAPSASDCSSSSLDNITSKWRRRCYGYDIVHSARSLYFHRYVLSVETAGGSYTAGWFRTKKDAHECRRSKWAKRDFRIYDKWKSVDQEMLDDMKTLAKLFNWRNYGSIHEAPLSLQGDL